MEKKSMREKIYSIHMLPGPEKVYLSGLIYKINLSF
jgi:hypothetical protein